MAFVSFEGIDGSGKTTQAKLFVDALRELGVTVVATKEPDGGKIGKEIRDILIKERDQPLSACEEALLVCAARYDHVRSVIRPAISAGKWVVCDRFIDSTFAFQVFENDVSEQFFDIASDHIIGQTIPSMTFILDIDPAEASLRRRCGTNDRHEDPAEARRDFSRIRRGLLKTAERFPSRCHVIDAAAAADIVADRIQGVAHRSGLLPTRPA